jgi:tetratricopeptide (TPR) repeat protein
LLNDALQVLQEVECNADNLQYKLTALRLLAQTARLQRDWDSALVTCHRWKAVHAEHALVLERHSFVELLQAEAMFYSEETICQLPSFLTECAASRTAPTDHRLAAGWLAMRGAHNSGDALSARAVFDAVRDLRGSTRASRISRLMIEAIYHGSFGCSANARSALEEAIRTARLMKHEIARHVHIRQACFGLLRFGDRGEAHVLLLEALSVFRRFELYSQALVCVEQLGQAAAWSGRFDEAKAWISESASLAPRISEFIARAVETALRTILAFETLDRSLLPERAQIDGYSRAAEHLKRVRQQTTASVLARALVLGEVPAADQVNVLEALYRVMRTQGDQDFPTAVLATALLALGRRTQARALLEEYFGTYRREINHPIPSLHRIAVDVGAAIDQTAESV